MVELTESQRKALKIIKEHGPIRPREFAEKMWPDSNGWRHHSKCGPKGSTRGGGMNLAGGGYLGKLARKGWVKSVYRPAYGMRICDDGYTITDAGRL